MITLARLFSHGLVLQRDAPVRVWGKADPGEKVTVGFLGNSCEAAAGMDGKWAAELPPARAGGPHTLVAGDVALLDVYVGDVWLCGGQSNMEMPMHRVVWRTPEEARASDGLIRQFLVTRRFLFEAPADDYGSNESWEAVTPQSIERFYAVPYFFAKELRRRYDVPIGLINAAAGGSTVEAWMPEGGGQSAYKNAQDVKKAQDADAERERAWHAALRAEEKNPDSALWQPINPTADWGAHPDLRKNGSFWFTADFDCPPDKAGRPGLLELGCIRDSDETYINGQLVGAITYQYPPRRYNVPEGLLKAGRNNLLLRVVSCRDVGGFVPDKPYALTVDGCVIDLTSGWRFQPGIAAREPLREAVMFEKEPAGLYNGMLAPAAAFPVRGALWYQGESNTHAPDGYKDKFARMVGDWRRRWRIGDFPVLYVQLPNFGAPGYTDSGWPQLREEQRRCLSVPRTAMVTAIDLGEWNDLHPSDKKSVGARLAQAAMNEVYGDKDAQYLGPQPLRCEREPGGGVYAVFDCGSEGEMRVECVKETCFAVEGDTVRYAWEDTPSGTLIRNKAGLPAPPFEMEITPTAPG
ncbi:MAG: sialate O-acetylesterase [Oscillospiraceae bacterium]|jgi:sialate O-acetylesterase|nr:sialate O-acetylesterase [Oscillospiraceae bacterium]